MLYYVKNDAIKNFKAIFFPKTKIIQYNRHTNNDTQSYRLRVHALTINIKDLLKFREKYDKFSLCIWNIGISTKNNHEKIYSSA